MTQRQVAAVVAGDARLVIVEGAAGAGKTTTLAAARAAIESDGHRLVVVTPTRKAAQVATRQLGGLAFSAAWLVHQHGWRWNTDGRWTHLAPGSIDHDDQGRQHPYPGPRPEAQLRPGDVLLVDEAGMLDQDTARALLHIADQHHARLVLVGDRHQLPAVGRGGVLDLAARYAHPDARVELATVHRFTDPDYAALSLAMRTGTDPDRVFDTLLDKTWSASIPARSNGPTRSPTPPRPRSATVTRCGCWPTPTAKSPRSIPRSGTGSSPPDTSTTPT